MTEKYQENPDHTPNPADVHGQLETSGTGGRDALHKVSAVFAPPATEKDLVPLVATDKKTQRK